MKTPRGQNCVQTSTPYVHDTETTDKEILKKPNH